MVPSVCKWSVKKISFKWSTLVWFKPNCFMSRRDKSGRTGTGVDSIVPGKDTVDIFRALSLSLSLSVWRWSPRREADEAEVKAFLLIVRASSWVNFFSLVRFSSIASTSSVVGIQPNTSSNKSTVGSVSFRSKSPPKDKDDSVKFKAPLLCFPWFCIVCCYQLVTRVTPDLSCRDHNNK